MHCHNQGTLIPASYLLAYKAGVEHDRLLYFRCCDTSLLDTGCIQTRRLLGWNTIETNMTSFWSFLFLTIINSHIRLRGWVSIPSELKSWLRQKWLLSQSYCTDTITIDMETSAHMDTSRVSESNSQLLVETTVLKIRLKTALATHLKKKTTTTNS